MTSRLIDENGNDISAYDVRGELCIKGPTIMMGYSKRSNEGVIDKDGYLMTGDICYCDGKTKKWYIVDRKKVRDFYFHLIYYSTNELKGFDQG